MATTKIIPNVLELNPGDPENVLKATNAVTVSNASGSNKYYFDGVYDGKFGLRIGTTVLTGVPSAHPIAIINNGKTSQISYTGTTSAGTGTGPDGNTYTFYYGDITITVSADFGTVSYYCLYHGYMGGQDNLVSVYSDAGLKMPKGTAFPGGETAFEGMMRNDTSQSSLSSASTMQHYNGTDWKNFVNTPDITPFNTSILIVAGGGSAAYSAGNGGAGAGGVLEGTLSLTPSTNYTLQVGAGGAISASYGNAGNNGENSNFDMSASGGNTYTAVGGGSGGGCSICGPGSPQAQGAGSSGGSGGGAGGTLGNSSCNTGSCIGGTSTQTNISPLTGYGSNGGANTAGTTSCYLGAGGGGAEGG